MDDLEESLIQAGAKSIRLRVLPERVAIAADDEALFDAVQLPLVALTTLACLSLRVPGRIAVSKIGLRVGATLMATFPHFGSVGRLLQWSLRVRLATANAMAFLEAAGLAEVKDRGQDRTLFITPEGRDFLMKTRRGETEAANLVDALRKAADSTLGKEFRLL